MAALSEGADSVDIADTLCNLAVCDLHRGYKQAAIGKFTKARDIYMKINPTNPHDHIIAITIIRELSQYLLYL